MPIYKISEEVVKRIASEFPEIASLSLANNEIQVIENLHSLSFLRTIDLAYNKIKLLDLNAFVSLRKLQELFLQYNQIAEVQGCRQFCSDSNLDTLDMSFNPLTSIETINPLAEVKGLKKLFLTGTPLSLSDEYRTKLVATFPQLEQLDGVDISKLPPVRKVFPSALEDQGVQTAAISVADADMQTAGSVAHSATQSMPRVVAPVSKEQLLAGRERIALKARQEDLRLREEALILQQASLEEFAKKEEAGVSGGSAHEGVDASTQADTPSSVPKVTTQSCAVQAEATVTDVPKASQTETITYELVETQTETRRRDEVETRTEASVQTAEVYSSEAEEWKRTAQQAQRELLNKTTIKIKQNTEATQTLTSEARTRAAQTDLLGSSEIENLKRLLEAKEKTAHMMELKLNDSERQRPVLLDRIKELEESLLKQTEESRVTKSELDRAQAALVEANNKLRDQAVTIKALSANEANVVTQENTGRIVALEQLLRAQDRIFEMESDASDSKALVTMKTWRDRVFELLVRERSNELASLEASRRARTKLHEAESRIEELANEKAEILEDHTRTKSSLQAMRAELLRERSSLLSAQGQLHHLSDSVSLSLKVLGRAVGNEEGRIFRRMVEASDRLCNLENQANALKTILPMKLNALNALQAQNKSLETALEGSLNDLKLSKERYETLQQELSRQTSLLRDRDVELHLSKQRKAEREIHFSQELSRKLYALEEKLRAEADRLRAEKDEERTLRLRFEAEIRQVRRQLARQHDKYEQSENSKNVFMAQKLKSKDHEIHCLRRERNVLLSALRGRNKSATTPTSPESSSRAETHSSETTMEFSSVTSPCSEGHQASASDGSRGAPSPHQNIDSVGSIERLAGLAAKVLSDEDSDSN